VRDDEILEFNDAAEWLDVAASVCKVEVLTGGEDVIYCETVMDYENARSDLLSHIVTELVVFQFVWGAFETVVKIVGPPPPSIKGADGLINKAVSFIKDVRPFPAYDELLDEVRCLLKHQPEYAQRLRQDQIPQHMGPSGIGIDFVRQVRNKFAHGAAKLPRPDDCTHGWCGKRSREPELVGLCCRIVLFTIQMVLAAYYAEKHFELNVLEDQDGFSIETDIHDALQMLHIDVKESFENL
jgi:hypothetical protein